MKRWIAMILLLIGLLTGCTIRQVEPEKTDTPEESTAPQEQPKEEVQDDIKEESQTKENVPEAAPEVTISPVDALIEEMTIEELVGQVFLARCPAVDAIEDVKKYHLGGYVLFDRDFAGETVESIQAKILSYQKASEIPMLIAVDEEGGAVTRVSTYPQFRSVPFGSPRWLYNHGGIDLIVEREHEKCELLTSLGINVNLAPVCDITTDTNAFMYSRSLGQNPEETGNFVVAVTNVMAEHQMGTVLKHFPGYGNNVDTHVGVAVDERSLEELEAVDLQPFAAGIKAGCGSVMVSHTMINCIDAERPATLSPAVHSYLRENMGFDGVILTDDLSMQAITQQYGAGEAAVLAILAGNDLLCSSEYQLQYEAVLNAVQSGRIPQSMLEKAVFRVLQWKYDIGLLDLNE